MRKILGREASARDYTRSGQSTLYEVHSSLSYVHRQGKSEVPVILLDRLAQRGRLVAEPYRGRGVRFDKHQGEVEPARRASRSVKF